MVDALFVENVVKRFGATEAVSDLSARVPAGCIYGFLGPNGAGKTTTIRMIMNIILPDKGKIAVFGNEKLNKAKDTIGYMPEERGLYRKMTVENMLKYLGAIKGMSRQQLVQHVPMWLERVGLADCAKKKIEELSRGMHQKVQFIATILHEPRLLILDEPFSGVDPVNLELLMGIVADFKKQGRTILFSTHIMDQAERLCDRIMLINKGKKVADGTMSEIRSKSDTCTVLLDIGGENGIIEHLPMVLSVEREGRTYSVILKEDATSQDLLSALVGQVHIHRFEERVASLHETFIKLVGEKDE